MSNSFKRSWNLYSLVDHGSTLAALLCRAKVREDEGMTVEGSENAETQSSISEKVEDVVSKFLEELEAGVQSGQLVEESMAKVMDKIKEILQELIKVDKGKDCYQKLIENLDERRSFSQKTRPVRPAGDFGPHSDIQQQYLSSDDDQPPEKAAEADARDKDMETFKLKFDELTLVEKNCLLCYPLLPVDVLLEKRVIMKWWLAMDLISQGLDGGKAEGDRILDKLVAKEFVDPPTASKFLSNMKFDVRTKLVLQDTSLMEFSQSDAFSIGIYIQSKKPLALLNIGEHKLDTKKFEFISTKKGTQVVHLGRWRQSLNHNQDEDDNMEDYIEVEDFKALDLALHQLGSQVKFLSLQGISGLVSLPESICKLTNLLVLDLRACNNLETLPKKIGSLRKLLYLDLSECYLLNYIPKGITSLSELVVLKGFIVNPHVRRGNHHKVCEFSRLTALKKLQKLTVRTRRPEFPTKADLQTLCSMSCLTSLRIAWGKTRDDSSHVSGDGSNQGTSFPTTLEKLELQAVPEVTATRLLRLITKKPSDIKLEKLHIRGAFGTPDLKNYCFPTVKQVRLRYLPQLEMDWDQFQRVFPNLTRLEIYKCPKLVKSFPCDANGVYDATVDEQLPIHSDEMISIH